MIVVAGEALVDRVVEPNGQATDALGGAPYNTARALGRLGCPVEYVGSISSDHFGSALLGRLADDGVGVTHVRRTDAPTTMAIAQIDRNGAATYRFVIEGTSAPVLDVVGVPAEVSAFVTGGLGLVLEPMASSICAAIGGLAPDVLVYVDVNCRPAVVPDREAYLGRVQHVLRRADVVKVSDEDLSMLAPEVTVESMLDVGAAVVLVTAGAAGSAIVTGDGEVTVPVPPLEGPVIDTIGAGDTFGAGFVGWWHAAGLGRADLVGRLADQRLSRAVATAHAAAAVVVTRRGCDPPRPAELSVPWPPPPGGL
jgi:fructokinase